MESYSNLRLAVFTEHYTLFFFFFEYKREFIRRIQFLAGTPTAKMSYELEAGLSAGHFLLSPKSFTSFAKSTYRIS